MPNKIANICKSDVKSFLKDEAENINVILNHLKTLKSTRSNRDIKNLFNFDLTESVSDKTIDEIKNEIFERCKFDFGDSLDESHITLLSDVDNIQEVEPKLLDIFKSLKSQQKRDLAVMITMKKGGQEFIQKHQLIDLKKVGIPVTFHCPICSGETDIKISILAISDGYTVRTACKHCEHIEAPRTRCRCKFCSRNQIVFELAKLLEDGLINAKKNANRKLQEAIDKEQLVEEDINLLNVFAKFMSLRSTLTNDAKEVVEKIMSIYSITGEFEQNTYQFTKNIVGEDKASAVASELSKAGFFYKAGFIPRPNGLNINPTFGVSSKTAQFLSIDKNGILNILNEIPSSSDADDISIFINETFCDDFYVHFDIQPAMWSVFKVNHYVLEHEVHGGIINTKESEEKHEDGSILKNKKSRNAYIKEKEAGQFQHIFPDIRIGKLIEIDDLRRIMNASTLSILETYEASIVCYDDNFTPKKVYINKISQSIDVIKNSVVPMLKSKNIDVVLL